MLRKWFFVEHNLMQHGSFVLHSRQNTRPRNKMRVKANLVIFSTASPAASPHRPALTLPLPLLLSEGHACLYDSDIGVKVVVQRFPAVGRDSKSTSKSPKTDTSHRFTVRRNSLHGFERDSYRFERRSLQVPCNSSKFRLAFTALSLHGSRL